MKAITLIKKLVQLADPNREIPIAPTVFGDMDDNKDVVELFKTMVVTFETLHEKMRANPKNKRLKARVERLRKGTLRAAHLCNIALEGPEYRFLCDEKPWYGTEDFK